MRNREPGKVCEGLWFLGKEESGVYLLEGKDQSMLISGGMRYILPAVLEQMEAFGRDREKIRKCLILHAHFDHVGIVPYMKRIFRDLDVCASERGWEILQMPKAVETINAFGRDVTERMGMEAACASYDLDWRDDISGSVVREGDVIDLGNVAVHILETPGHSSCAIAAYIPRVRALFPSDAGGIPYKETNVTFGNSNYTKFQKSLDKLRSLEVDYYCADHYGYITGTEARGFIRGCIEAAQAHRERMETTFRDTGSIEGAVGVLVKGFLDENPDYILTPAILEGIYRQMVKHIASSLG